MQKSPTKGKINKFQDMGYLESQGPQIDFDKINEIARYNTYSSGSAQQASGKQNNMQSGIKTQTMDYNKAMEFLKSVSEKEPEEEEFQNSMMRLENSLKLQNDNQHQQFTEEKCMKLRVHALEQEIKELKIQFLDDSKNGDGVKQQLGEIQQILMSLKDQGQVGDQMEQLNEGDMVGKQSSSSSSSTVVYDHNRGKIILLSSKIRKLMYSELATCYKPQKRFRNLMDFLVYLSRLFKVSKQNEINKVNQRAIKLNNKIDDFIKLKKKQAKAARSHGATQSLAVGGGDAKKKKGSDFWQGMLKGGPLPNKQKVNEPPQVTAQPKNENDPLASMVNSKLIEVSKEASIYMRKLPKFTQKVILQSQSHQKCADIILRTKNITSQLSQLQNLLKYQSCLRANLNQTIKENEGKIQENLKSLKERAEKVKHLKKKG